METDNKKNVINELHTWFGRSFQHPTLANLWWMSSHWSPDASFYQDRLYSGMSRSPLGMLACGTVWWVCRHLEKRSQLHHDCSTNTGLTIDHAASVMERLERIEETIKYQLGVLVSRHFRFGKATQRKFWKSHPLSPRRIKHHPSASTARASTTPIRDQFIPKICTDFLWYLLYSQCIAY